MSRWLGAGLAAACAVALGFSAMARAVAGDEEDPIRKSVIRMGAGGFLGVWLEEVQAADVSRLRLAEERGALVREVEPDSPASAAGLKADDVIVGYQVERVHSAAQLSRLVRETPAGRSVPIEVSRNGSIQKLTVTLREGKRGWLGDTFDFDFPMPAIDVRPPRAPRAPRPPRAPALPDGEWGDFALGELLHGRGGRLGLSYQQLTDQLARYFKVEDGLLVVSVKEGSPAAEAGVKAGDVIVKVNGKPVRRSEDLRGELDRAEPGSELALGVQREGRALDLKVKLRNETRERIRRPELTL